MTCAVALTDASSRAATASVQAAQVVDGNKCQAWLGMGHCEPKEVTTSLFVPCEEPIRHSALRADTLQQRTALRKSLGTEVKEH